MNILRKLSLPALAATLLFVPSPSAAQDPGACWLRGETTPEAAAERPSPLGVVAITMSGETAQVCYARPSARDREVMGALVPYGEVWRTGANEATQLHLPFDATIGGAQVPAGVYSLYTIPGESEWQFFLSSEYQRWGIPVTDAVRAAEVAQVTRSVAATDDMVETFTISWDSHGEMMGHLVFEWEHTRVELPIHHGGMSH